MITPNIPAIFPTVFILVIKSDITKRGANSSDNYGMMAGLITLEPSQDAKMTR